MRMRGGAGLGDAMYVRVVAEHFAKKGQQVVVATPYPDVFDGAGVETIPFTRSGIDVLAHYSEDRFRQETSQFLDMCLRARIREEVPLRFDWKPKNEQLLEHIRQKAAGRKVLLVNGGREPFGRTDGLGMELLPKQSAFCSVLSGLSDFLTVSIGDGKRQFYSLGAEVDLIGQTSVKDLLDLGRVCDGFVAQVGFCVPMAECFGKPFLGVWAAKGLYGPVSRPLLKTVTPKKILTKKTSLYVIDNWQPEQIKEGVDAFRELLGCR